MILQSHSVLYVAKLPKVGKLGQASAKCNDSAITFCSVCCKAAKGGKVRAGFREMQKKIFYLINLDIV